VRAELIRRLRLCTREAVFRKEQVEVLLHFMWRGYPLPLLLQEASRVKFTDREKERKKVLTSIDRLRAEAVRAVQNADNPLKEATSMQKRSNDLFFKVQGSTQLDPVVGFFRRQLQRKIACRIMVARRNPPNLLSMLKSEWKKNIRKKQAAGR